MLGGTENSASPADAESIAVEPPVLLAHMRLGRRTVRSLRGQSRPFDLYRSVNLDSSIAAGRGVVRSGAGSRCQRRRHDRRDRRRR